MRPREMAVGILGLLLIATGTARAGTVALGPASGDFHRSFTIPINRGGGYTHAVVINVNDPRIATIIERYLEKKPLGQGGLDYQCLADCAFDGSWAWNGPAIANSVMRFISIACASVSTAAQMLGYLNIYVDAANALCSSFVLVTEVLEPGTRYLYNATMRQLTPQDTAAIWVNLFGSCGAYPIC